MKPVYNENIFLVRDVQYLTEIENIINKISGTLTRDSLFGYVMLSESIEKLSLILNKSSEDYYKCYLNNKKKLDSIKDTLSWKMFPPYTDFEAKVVPVIAKAETLLEEKHYYSNAHSKLYLDQVEESLNEYIEKTHLVDKGIRKDVHIRINNIKTLLTSGSLVSFFFSEEIICEIEKVIRKNEILFKKNYLNVINRSELSRSAFENSKRYFKIKDSRIIEEQFDEITSILDLQDYEKYDDAVALLDMIDEKLNAIFDTKKNLIVENLLKDVDKLKKEIWLEDWVKIKRSADLLIDDADKTGHLNKLNLDSFNIDQKKSAKKNLIIQFISSIERKKIQGKEKIIIKARQLIDNECSEEEFNKLKESSKSSPKRFLTGKEKKIPVRNIVMILVMILAIVLFSFNHVQNKVHYDKKGNEYAFIVATIVKTYKKTGEEINKTKIRKKLLISQEELKIIDINDNEVVIEFKGDIYKCKL